MKPLLKDLIRTALTVSVAMFGVYAVVGVFRPCRCVLKMRPASSPLQIVALESGKNSAGIAINNRGEVVGVEFSGEGTARGFVLRGRKPALLPMPKGASESVAAGINDEGIVVGSVGAGASVRGVLWRGEQVGVLSGGQRDTLGMTVAQSGVAAGIAIDGPPPPMLPNLWTEQPSWELERVGQPLAAIAVGMVWKRPGEGKEIGAFFPQAGNESGVLAGVALQKDQPLPALFKNGKIASLPAPEGVRIAAPMAVNDSEIVVGGAVVGEGDETRVRPVGWSNGRSGFLPVPGGRQGMALGINGNKVVVGTISVGERWPHAALWKDGKVVDLDKAVKDKNGWTLIQARDINDKGQIVGTAVKGDRIAAFVVGCP
jgi:hypothetical protein